MKLGHKIYGMTIGLILVFSIVIGIVFIDTVESSRVNDAESQYLANANSTRNFLSVIDSPSPHTILKLYMESNEMKEDVYYYYMADSNNNIVLSSLGQVYPVELYPEILPTSCNSVTYNTAYNNNRCFAVCTRLECGCYLYIGYDMEKVYSDIWGNKMGIVIIVSIISLFFIIISYYLARSILEPINELSDGTKKFANGELGYRFQEDRKDELGQLMKAYNEMAEAHNNSKKNLLQLYEELKKNKEDLEEFTRGFYHDVQTPLSTIGGYSSLLLEASLKADHETMLHSTKVIKNAASDLSFYLKGLGDKLRRI